MARRLAASGAYRRGADDVARDHDRPGRHHSGGGAADDRAPRTEAAGHDEKGKLVGIVSRRDLISVFLRPDADIAADIRRVLDDIVLARPGEAEVAVHNGIVTLTGTLDPKAGSTGTLSRSRSG